MGFQIGGRYRGLGNRRYAQSKKPKSFPNLRRGNYLRGGRKNPEIEEQITGKDGILENRTFRGVP